MNLNEFFGGHRPAFTGIVNRVVSPASMNGVATLFCVSTVRFVIQHWIRRQSCARGVDIWNDVSPCVTVVVRGRPRGTGVGLVTRVTLSRVSRNGDAAVRIGCGPRSVTDRYLGSTLASRFSWLLNWPAPHQYAEQEHAG